MDNLKPAIEVFDLSVSYRETEVLKEVTFQVLPGEIFVVLGESGCGKTTLLRHMIGLREPQGGTVFFAGENFYRMKWKKREKLMKKFGVLFQSGALLGSLTLGENVALPLVENTKLSKKMIFEIVRLKLSLVGLEDKAHLYPAELSGGMKKRGGLARAMVLDPQILFFDEPSAGLDPVTQVELDELILNINGNLGTTIVVVTHELQSIFKIAGRCIMLDSESKGIIAEGKPEELRDTAEHPRVKAFFRREKINH